MTVTLGLTSKLLFVTFRGQFCVVRDDVCEMQKVELIQFYSIPLSKNGTIQGYLVETCIAALF